MIVYEGTERRADGLELQYVAERPSEPWLAGPTRVAGWQDVAVVCDVLFRRILGWGVSSSRWIHMALVALEQAPHGRSGLDGLVNDTDRCGEWLSNQFARLEWLDRFNNGRQLPPFPYVPAVESEALYQQPEGAGTKAVIR